MAKYVTLIKNPGGKSLTKNPHRRRHHRNPDAIAAVTRNLPDMEEIAGGLLGALAATQIPAMFARNSTGWVNVLWSAGGTVVGGVVLRMLGMGGKLSNAYMLGGGLITVLKAAHVATNGSFGIPTSLRVAPSFGLPAATAAPAAASLPTSGASGLSISPGTRGARSGVAAFRESEFARPALSSGEEPLLT